MRAALRRLVAVATIALLGVSGAPVKLSIHVDRQSFDLLDSLAIGVVLDNPGKAITTTRFANPSEYQIDVLQGDRVVWSSTTAQSPRAAATYPAHDRAVVPGTNTLAVYEWNELTSGLASPTPGDYTIRVRLLTTGEQPQATTRVRFIEPTPISAIAKLKLGDAITIAGQLDDEHSTLTDDSGSTMLPRKLLGTRASGRVVVRGYITARPNGTRFLNILRWAPYYE